MSHLLSLMFASFITLVLGAGVQARVTDVSNVRSMTGVVKAVSRTSATIAGNPDRQAW